MRVQEGTVSQMLMKSWNRFHFAIKVLRSRPLTFFVLATLLVCTGTRLNAEPCTPDFAIGHGWLGADAAYSIPQPDGHDVWIFGDTLYGTHRVVNGNDPVMVRNSIGISSCTNGRWKIRYVLRKDVHGQPVSFFQPSVPGHWYWAMDGFRSGDNLWITLLCVRASAKSALGFETCGSDLARITAPGANPLAWKITYLPLVPDGVDAYPSASAVVSGKFAYLFALNEKRDKPLIVTRIALDGLSDPQGHLEYLAKNGTWKHGFAPDQAQAIMTPGSSELSVRYHPELNKWVAVMFEPSAFSRRIVFRTAPSLTGPWSVGRTIYSAPEMDPDATGYDKDTFCYAAKEHPEFEKTDLVFTYVCNTLAVPKLAQELNIYVPRTIRMPMPSK